MGAEKIGSGFCHRHLLRSGPIRLLVAPPVGPDGCHQLCHSSTQLGRSLQGTQDRPFRRPFHAQRVGSFLGWQHPRLDGGARALRGAGAPALRKPVRESLQRQLKACAQRGRSLALQFGYDLKGDWFGVRRWPRLELPNWLLKLLEPLRQNALGLWHLLGAQTAAIEQASAGPKPRGVGPLAEQILEREIGDWKRFKNRRQVSSFLGLCPGEHSSGSTQRKGGITKAGNARARVILVQIAWRLLVHQPRYRLVKKWRPHLVASNATTRRRKQIIVALARGFAVDWWRLRTRQTTPEQLGLVMSP